ncbi:MAG: phenylacetate--CoA ligase family protein [Nitrososphaera sp.]
MNPDIEISKKFPIQHPLYGRIESLSNAPILTPKKLAEFTNEYSFEGATELEVCPQCFFQTSGTSGRSKRIPHSELDLQKQVEHEALAFSIAGLGSQDVILTLAAPPPSISAWATINGSKKLGAEVVNTSYYDYDEPIKNGDSKKVTAFFATPIIAQSTARMVQEIYGNTREIFPKLRMGIIFGDVLPPPLERKLRQLWGCEIRRLYGSVEADVLAIECAKGEGTLHLMTSKLIFEIIPEEEMRLMRTNPNHLPRIKNIRDCKNGERGEILVTDLAKEVLPLIRYRIGDVVEIYTEKCKCGLDTPRVRVLGRAANTLFLDDNLIHEMQLHYALENTFEGQYSDWVAYVSSNGNNISQIEIAIETTTRPWSTMMQTFYENIRQWCNIREIRNCIKLNLVDSLPKVEVKKADMKSKRIIFQ